MTTAQSEDTGEEDSFSEVSLNTRSTIGFGRLLGLVVGSFQEGSKDLHALIEALNRLQTRSEGSC